MATQRALLVSKIGKPVVSTSDWPIPSPRTKQLQIRVTTAGLNPHDWKARDRGPGVTRFKVGDFVFSQGNLEKGSLQRGLQQYAVVDEDFTAKVPTGFTDDEAITLPTNIIASLVALFDPANLNIPAPWTEEAKAFDYTGMQILIIGGGSNCGRFAIQLAKLAGIGEIVVVGGTEEQLGKLGATHVLDRHGGHDVVLERIRQVVGDGLLYAFDAVNDPTGQHLGINALSNSMKGSLARLVPYDPAGVLEESKIHDKVASYEIKNVFGASPLHPVLTKPFWERVEQYLVQHKIVPGPYAVEQGLDADKVNEVLDRYGEGQPVKHTHFRIST
ncbi:putative alcohol dehydrogenase [Lojkania enalia]|uniref:Alcohol dehydrogenase n=1 Tax=Lojkania enalia TaxID=147567 RepID=A0A9P4K1G8_9PLEO|nr:putative alcohol dehydrogenase [Didymosphaeria enalia]